MAFNSIPGKIGDPVPQEGIPVNGQLKYVNVKVITNTLPQVLYVYTCKFPVCNLMKVNA